jgi:hypothetical protein
MTEFNGSPIPQSVMRPWTVEPSTCAEPLSVSQAQLQECYARGPGAQEISFEAKI